MRSVIQDRHRFTLSLCVTALLTGMNIALSSFGISVPGGHLYLNDIVIVIGSLLLNPVSAFVIGGIGAFFGDMIFYPAPMFVSLVTHGLQAVAISLIAHYTFREKKLVASVLGVSVGAIIMVVGYSFGRAWIYSTPDAAWLKLPCQILQAVVGAVVGTLLCHRFGIIRVAREMGFYYDEKTPAYPDKTVYPGTSGDGSK